MRTLLGIDIGTSSVKAMLLDVETGAVNIRKSEYNVSIPDTDCAEQDPEIWWDGLKKVLYELRTGEESKQAFSAIAGIGFSGQMHGLVTVDKNGNPVRPALIWLDQRAKMIVDEVNEQLSDNEKRTIVHNRISAGFAFPSLIWMKRNEYENYSRIHKILLPKDYIRYKITGNIGTDKTDASATGIFDVAKREWAWPLIEKFGLNSELFPDCFESYECAGCVSEECAAETGLKKGIPVVYGCGDQMAQSIGNGVFQEGKLVSNFGTGGQVSAYVKNIVSDTIFRTNTFCHAVNKGYSVFGATLNCGSAFKWICKNMYEMDQDCYTKCSELASKAPAGSKGIIYLPYLSGERTPVMNAEAKGVFFGLKLEHSKNDILRSALEGIIFSLKDCLVTLQQMNIDSEEIIASGGGASNGFMLQMQADIFEKKIKVCNVNEQACLGACIVSGVGLGLFSMESACEKFVTFRDRIYIPNSSNKDVYREQFERYHKVYENTKNIM